MTYSTYSIWRKQTADRCQTAWIHTGHTVRARSTVEAQSRVKRKFRHAGFHSMSLVASLTDPNQK